MNKLGLTMVELTLVLGLVLLLGTVSSGWYSRFLTQNAVADTTDYVVETLRKAQAYATSGKQNRSWGVSYSGQVITLYAVGTTAFNEVHTINPNITITGLTSIEFVGLSGVPSAPASITVSGNNTVKTITVNAQGVISR